MQNLSEHTNRGELKSTHEMRLLLEKILEEARTIGASDAQVSVSYDCGYSVNIRMQEVETVAFSEQQSIGVCVYDGHRKGSASSSDTSDDALKAMVLAAYEIAKVSAADPCFGLPERELLINAYPDLDLMHPWALTPTEGIVRAKEIEAYAMGLDPRISNSDGVSLSNYVGYSGYANSYGFRGIVPGSRHSVSASFIAKEQEKMQRDYAYTTARCADTLMSSEALAQLAVERTVSRLGAQRLKTQTCPVLFSSRVSSGLFSALIQAISGGNLYRKHSFLLDHIGKTLFPETIQVYEQPHLSRALGSSPFDDEGVLTRPNRFIENGVLTQYVLGSYSARKLGLKTTANSGGVSNLTIDSTTAGGFDELLKKMHRGFLVTDMMGQGVNLLTGDYSRGANGFWVDHGEIQYAVEEVTIAGNLRDMFQHILAIGSDINENIATRCGSILLEKMTIAGD